MSWAVAGTDARLRSGTWWGVGVVASTALAYTVVYAPLLTLGVVAGTALLVLLLSQPLLSLGLILAVGPMDLSFLTGGFKGIDLAGGLDMNGIRLVAVVAGFGALALADRRVLRAATGPCGRMYLVFLAFAAASILYSRAPMDGVRLLFKLAYPFLVFAAVAGAVRTREELDRIADWALAGAAAITLVINPFFVLAGGYEYDLEGNLRVQGVGIHENPFSFYLLAVLLLALSRYFARRQTRYLVLAGACAAWIVLALTRSTFIASMVALLALGGYAGVVARNYRAVAAASIFAGLLAVGLMPALLERTFDGPPPSIPQLLALAGDPALLFESVRLSGREVIWGVVFLSFLGAPWIGRGLGSSTPIMNEMLPYEAGGVVHNEYLRLAVETGVVGCALYALAVAGWARGVIAAGRAGGAWTQEYALPAVGLLLAWCLIAASDNPFDYYASFTQFVAFACGAAVAAGRIEQRAAAEGA